jgi:23S rRNA (adenine2503-C2)-methyltransferase
MPALIGMTTSQLRELAQSLGQPSYRGSQLAQALYRRWAADVGMLTSLPRAFRQSLAAEYSAGTVSEAARTDAPDGTVKFLLSLFDGEQVEAVYLPYEDRVSLCVSSQVGCAAGCTFCATALGGLARNLGPGEIVEQYLYAQRIFPNRRISHIVFMGMGEPLMNYENVLQAVRLLKDEVGVSARHITLSTVGVVPGILRLAQEDLPVTLAVSLHAPDDALRRTLIPTANKWSLEEILEACRTYHSTTRRNLTFEYLVLGGVNDSEQQAHALAERLGDLPGNVNLIPWNVVETPQGFRRPEQARVAAFRRVLEAHGRVTTQRMERGHAIAAACGQLRRTQGTIRPPRRLLPVVSA